MTEAALFVQATFAELHSELGDEDTAEVLKGFINDTDRKTRSMASGTRGRLEIRREAHSIKSSAGTFGFQRLSMLAHDLELRAETVLPEQLDELIRMLRNAFEEIAAFSLIELLKFSTETAS